MDVLAGSMILFGFMFLWLIIEFCSEYAPSYEELCDHLIDTASRLNNTIKNFNNIGKSKK